jgi:hypothetical protein
MLGLFAILKIYQFSVKNAALGTQMVWGRTPKHYPCGGFVGVFSLNRPFSFSPTHRLLTEQPCET